MANEKRLIDANAFKNFLEEVRQDYLEEDTFSSDFAAKVIETVQDEYLFKAPTVYVTRQLEELEEAVASQRKRADRAETFICMMCAECEWEEHNGLITMQKACCSLFPIDCGKFKLRPNCGEKMDLKEE